VEWAVNEKIILMLMLLGTVVLLANGHAWRLRLRRVRRTSSPQA